MSYHFGIVIESVVALLLAATIVFAVRLERQLRGLRLGEDALRKTIQELGTATAHAERAVGDLRQALEDSDLELAAQVRIADRRASDLKAQIQGGEDVLARISRIVIATAENPRMAA